WSDFERVARCFRSRLCRVLRRRQRWQSPHAECCDPACSRRLSGRQASSGNCGRTGVCCGCQRASLSEEFSVDDAALLRRRLSPKSSSRCDQLVSPRLRSTPSCSRLFVVLCATTAAAADSSCSPCCPSPRWSLRRRLLLNPSRRSSRLVLIVAASDVPTSTVADADRRPPWIRS